MLNRRKDRLYGAHTLFYKKGQPLEKSSLADTIPRFYKVEPTWVCKIGWEISQPKLMGSYPRYSTTDH